MADTKEKDAVKLYLDNQVKHWFCWLFNMHGVRFNEIHQALAHFRWPWIDASVLRSAQTRWKVDLLDQQLPRAPNFVIPAPPVPEPHLLLMMGLELDELGNVVKSIHARHMSQPLPHRSVHPHVERQYRSGPNLMTSHIGLGGAVASNPRTGISSPYNTGPSQQQYHTQGQTFISNPTSQQTSQATLYPLPYHPPPPPPPRSAGPTHEYSMEDAEHELVEDGGCRLCTGKCSCHPAF